MIDLHVHSVFSDGSLTPAELVAEASRIGLTALGLTDHDTMDGIPALHGAAATATLEAVPGVEISAEVEHGTAHILGYYADGTEPGLRDALCRIRDGRSDRNRQILRRLAGLGVALDPEDLTPFAGGDVVGRPHIAQAMVAKGYVKTTREAFERYLGKGRPGYVDRFRLSPDDSVAHIRRAGGVPVLAHPFTLELSPAGLREWVNRLRDRGLEGIEAYYSEHSPERQAQYLALARELDLAVTGGSDFHGAANPQIRLGSGFGWLRVPDELVDALRARRERVLTDG